MRAAGASILRDTSTGLLSSVMVQSSLSLCACPTERTSVVHTVGRCRSRKFIHRSEFPILGPIRGIHFGSAVSKVEHAPEVPISRTRARGSGAPGGGSFLRAVLYVRYTRRVRSLRVMTCSKQLPAAWTRDGQSNSVSTSPMIFVVSCAEIGSPPSASATSPAKSSTE